MMRLYLLIPFLFLQTHRPQLQLAHDLKKDKEIIMQEHGGYNRHIDFKKFEPYARLDLSNFKFEEYSIGNNVIKKWTRSGQNQLILYQILTKTYVDRVIHQKAIPVDEDVRKNQKEKYETVKIKKQVDFRSYFIVQPSGKQLIYITQTNDGLYKYYVDGKAYLPLYKAIGVGIKYPDVDELKKLLK
ncbi:hypothetical protein IM792_20620 [Mucilaginibacter sp. JRF]|uniref:hypothetical protein n=1 Tax=Mucilaginibacter sp. JRF TaxID=2780088 RepID=UPI00187F6CCB|nr:hypothetical protein [Mucilaginibacter sp. JRF]MBE9586865.1 hypothetical protein [Mucilaginibacter sp. JRF]